MEKRICQSTVQRDDEERGEKPTHRSNLWVLKINQPKPALKVFNLCSKNPFLPSQSL